MKIIGIVLEDTAHVYPVREDSLLLASSAEVNPGEMVLEVGCGRGLASMAATLAGANVVASDLNPHALAALRDAAAQRSSDIACVRTDLFAGLGAFEVVLFNPPYLPTDDAGRDKDPWVDLALNGGPDGTEVLGRFLSDLPAHLNPSGRAYILAAKLPGMTVDPVDLIRSQGGLELTGVCGERWLEGEHLRVVEVRRRPRGGGPHPHRIQ